jgi:hypothetical protein
VDIDIRIKDECDGGDMLGLIILALANLVIILYGINRVIKELRANQFHVLFILINENDNQLEDLLRFVIRQIRKKAISRRLVLLYEISGYQTEAIAERLARDLSFIVREINKYQRDRSIDGYLDYNVLDLRGKDNRKEKRQLIESFIKGHRIVEYQEY